MNAAVRVLMPQCSWIPASAGMTGAEGRLPVAMHKPLALVPLDHVVARFLSSFRRKPESMNKVDRESHAAVFMDLGSSPDDG
jgi:hypothetical protein